MRRRTTRLTAIALALASVVAACGGDDDDAADSTTPSSAAVTDPSETTTDESTAGTDPDTTEGDGSTTTPSESTTPTSEVEQVDLDPDATINVIATAPPLGHWDPTRVPTPTQAIGYFTYVYDNLVTLDGDNQVQPELATEWEYDDTNTVLTMTLRDDVTFSDGTAFTAEVAKANLDRVIASTSGAAQLLSAIASIEAASPTELVITQTGPSPRVLFALASPAGVMISGEALANPDSLTAAPVGSGPYLLDSADLTSATFVRNDDYWDDSFVYAKEHKVTGTADSNARVNAVLSGSEDLMHSSQQAPTPDILARVDEGSLQMELIPGQPTVIGINNKVPPFDNPKVRLAINYAFNRDAYNEVVYAGACEPASQPFAAGQVGYIDGLEYEFDVERARQLMDESGVGEVTVDFQSVAGTNTAPAELVKSMLAEIGITVNIVLSPVQEVVSRFANGEFGMSVTRVFLPAPDPSFVTDYLTGPNNPGTPDPELVELVDAANSLAVDDPDRAEAYEAVTEYVFENPVWLSMCMNPGLLVASSDIVGMDDIPFVAVGGMDTSRLGKALS